ncbi:hypothetical protein [Pseudomonas sp. 7-41]|jgi:hypothetical protein|uniref:hypothetical protein n=1 Tax=Pseudomonas sp. 7-41 TaxID=2898483 RepID=UPI0004D8B607|nr:hypothetical protein [Pseudomonas sp. 7-41]KEX94317.1 hypothetical protein HA62_08285 [Pseudomonas putida]MBX9764692.1 hypothetical protein [Pseudomonadaceae bacterium]UHH00989.1 hypothetical protein LQ249_30360 [Pseudomonas sp. 7-41]
MSRKKPTQRDLDLLAMSSIASQLPVRFENKTAWHVFAGECRGCNQTIPDEHLRGAVTRTAQWCFTIEASGYCPECRSITRFLLRLHDDLTASGPMNGLWQTWKPKRKAGFAWLLRFLKLTR